MRERIIAINVYEANSYSVREEAQVKPKAAEHGNLYPGVITDYKETLTLDELDALQLSISTGSPWHTEQVLSVNDRVVVHFDTTGDGTADLHRCYRIRNLAVGTGEESSLTLQCWSIDGDLRRYLWAYKLGEKDPTLRRNFDYIGFTLNQVLGEIFNGVGLPAAIRLGTVAPEITNLEINPHINGNTYTEVLGIIRDRMLEDHGKSFEYEHVYDHSKGTITFNFVEYRGGDTDHSKRVIRAPGIATEYLSNRKNAVVTNVQDDYVSRLIPTAGNPDDEEINVAQIEWACLACEVVDTQVVITPESGLIGFVDQFKGHTLFQGGSNQFRVDSNTLHTLTVTPLNTVFLTDSPFKIAVQVEDVGLVWLDYVKKPEDEEELGVVYQKQNFRVTPYENLFRKSGGSADISEWESGFPKGFGVIEIEEVAPTITENTERKYISNGTRSMRVQAPKKGMGVRASVRLEPTDLHPYCSVDCVMQVESGSVRMFIIDSVGERFPPTNEKQHDGRGTVTFALRLEGAELAAGIAHVWIEAKEDETDFYVDSLSVTQSHTAWTNTALMGPKALWKTAVQWMQKDGGRKPLTTNVQFVDLTYLSDVANPITVGSHVRLEDLPGEDGLPKLFLEGRVQSIDSGPFMPISGVFQRVATIGRQRNTIIQTLAAGAGITQKHIPVAPTSNLPLSLSAYAWYGLTHQEDGTFRLFVRWQGGDTVGSIRAILTYDGVITMYDANVQDGGHQFDVVIGAGQRYHLAFYVYRYANRTGESRQLIGIEDIADNPPPPPPPLDGRTYKTFFADDITGAEVLAKLREVVDELSDIRDQLGEVSATSISLDGVKRTTWPEETAELTGADILRKLKSAINELSDIHKDIGEASIDETITFGLGGEIANDDTYSDENFDEQTRSTPAFRQALDYYRGDTAVSISSGSRASMKMSIKDNRAQIFQMNLAHLDVFLQCNISRYLRVGGGITVFDKYLTDLYDPIDLPTPAPQPTIRIGAGTNNRTIELRDSTGNIVIKLDGTNKLITAQNIRVETGNLSFFGREIEMTGNVSIINRTSRGGNRTLLFNRSGGHCSIDVSGFARIHEDLQVDGKIIGKGGIEVEGTSIRFTGDVFVQGNKTLNVSGTGGIDTDKIKLGTAPARTDWPRDWTEAQIRNLAKDEIRKANE